MSIILFDGLSERNSQKMCKFHIEDQFDEFEKFYNAHSSMIKKTVFQDSFFSFNFWKIISENIKRSHSLLHIILRKQYIDADKVFTDLREKYKLVKHDIPEKVLYHIILKSDILRNYAQQVYHFIILPVLYRHHIYSPIMCLMIFIDIMYVMCGNYIDKGLLVQNKILLSNYKKCVLNEKEIDEIPWMSVFEKKMLRDELQAHKVFL